jgi:hypothetical protein
VKAVLTAVNCDFRLFSTFFLYQIWRGKFSFAIPLGNCKFHEKFFQKKDASRNALNELSPHVLRFVPSCRKYGAGVLHHVIE